MLTAEQKAEAERKLKLLNQQKAIEQQLKLTTKKVGKLFNDTIGELKNDPKKLIEILKDFTSNKFGNYYLNLDSSLSKIIDLQQKLKNDKQRNDKQAIHLLEEKMKYDNGVNQIKNTIVHIQKTVKQSVEEEGKKRKKIQDDLQKSLDQIRGKIKQFEKQSQDFDKQNAQLKSKIDGIKAKLGDIQTNFKIKAEEKDEEVKKQKQQLTQNLKVLQQQVQKATQLNKQYGVIQKKNFDNKVALYLKTKKFPEFSLSFENSAQTLGSCKQQLIKGVDRLNKAADVIENCQKITQQNNNLYLSQLKKLQIQKAKNDQIKAEKTAVRQVIIDLQAKLKQKKQQK